MRRGVVDVDIDMSQEGYGCAYYRYSIHKV
jgi:hypothetical protein